MGFIVNLLSSDIRLAVPILIAALGLCYSERAGIVNIGAEGIMLIGALTGYIGSYYLNSSWGGLAAAMIVGLAIGLLFAFLVITLRANQTVVGAALNIFGSGITIMLNRIIFGMNAQRPTVQTFGTLNLGALSNIPVAGPIFFSHNILVPLSVCVLVISYIVLFKTKLGLKIRAVGENPKACDTLGINVYRIRYGTVLYSTLMCGAAGAYLSLAQVTCFTEGMTAGRGFIALAAVVFGRWNPLGVLLAVLVFGLGEALQIRLDLMQTGIPYQILQMLPYVLTILALVGAVGKAKAPAASGIAYKKE
ncbi:MAG: ABC transporter permease [Bacillota bacterium]